MWYEEKNIWFFADASSRPVDDVKGIILHVATLLPWVANKCTSYRWKRKQTFKTRTNPGSVFLFLECGGETVKDVLEVPESVSTEAVVLFYQVHKTVTALHCLLQPPFRYCTYLLFFHCFLFISLSSRVRLFSKPLLLSVLNFFFSYMWSSQSDKSDDLFPLFFASCPPTSFLSSVLSLHTVFPTYMPCTMCNTYIVTHAPTRIHTYTNHNAVHITVALVFLASRNAHTNWYITISWHTPTLQLPESKHQVIAISDNFQSLKHLLFIHSSFYHFTPPLLPCVVAYLDAIPKGKIHSFSPVYLPFYSTA